MKEVLFYLLYPFSLLYKTVTSFRNHLYDIGHFHSFDFQIKTISVGNLTVGGTGKTPHVEYLINLLNANYRICTLSRGYGRRSRGIIIANSESTPTLIGDEPMQYFLKYGQSINVAVGEERALAIPTIIHELPDIKLILLDDAYQHRPVVPGYNILLCDYNRPFFEDHLMPAGRLRESRNGGKRADIILVSKCPPTLSETKIDGFREHLSIYKKSETLVLFTGIRYKDPTPIFQTHVESENVILLSGIANSQVFEANMSAKYKVLDSIIFKDHHQYTLRDVDLIKKKYADHSNKDLRIICTEKDMVKLIAFKEHFGTLPIYYIPIEVYFLKSNEKELFEQKILAYMESEII